MELPPSYCRAIQTMAADSAHIPYHNLHYGFPITDDNELFERLILEINQAGLSWTTILNKQANFKKAYDNFDIKKVANYGDTERERLLSDAGIIRNRLKINAAIHNAQVIIELQQTHGSFYKWLETNHPKTKEEWTKLFKKTFRFTGGEIVNEFLMSIGILPGAHLEACPIYKDILKTNPLWVRG
jgi:DNA-3-methyladenine glycosylase I